MFKRWVHSREEDTEKEAVYRPAGYKLPLSRGRDAFELTKDGGFIKYGIGRDDAPDITKGRYETEGKNVIRVVFDKSQSMPQKSIEVISHGEDILKIKK
jgi:hypothetical protein